MNNRLQIVIGAEEAGLRLDVLVARVAPDLSRAAAATLINRGGVHINGHTCKPATRPVIGARLEIDMPQLALTSAAAESIPLTIIYEDDDIVVVDKPAGMVVHPAPGNERGTLVNALLGRYADMTGDPMRPGIVHRLDKDTSGLIIVARTQAAIAALARDFKARQVHKEYLALVIGTLKQPLGAISADIGRDPRRRQRMAVVADGGRKALTAYSTVQSFKHFSLLRVAIETGRTHQIRVHFSALGHPVVGDTVYGRPVRGLQLNRQFLHAALLRVRHPRTGEDMEFTAPLPTELVAVLGDLQSAADSSAAPFNDTSS